VRPKILIVGPGAEAAYFEPYAEAIRFIGGDPELRLPEPEIAADGKKLSSFLNPYKGVLLPGGADIDPYYYGEEPHPKSRPARPDLDKGQLAVARILIREFIPTLAICRGLQVVTVAAGGTLYQDLPSLYESKIKVKHRISEPEALAHPVDADKGSRLADICGATRFEVNSRHHQAAREGKTAGRIGPLRIAARAPDGVIEGMEIPAHPFFLAVQWHPENLVKTHAPSQNLIRAFIDSCPRD